MSEKMSTIAVSIATLTALALSIGQPASAADRRFEVGRLICKLRPHVGLIVGSRQRIDCQFVRTRHRRVENYLGTVTRFGLDLGITVGGVMSWGILMTTRMPARGALAGHYLGASGDVSLGFGVGAKVLVGGSRRTTVLQPVSVSGRVGINLAAGVTGLTLRYSR